MDDSLTECDDLDALLVVERPTHGNPIQFHSTVETALSKAPVRGGRKGQRSVEFADSLNDSSVTPRAETVPSLYSGSVAQPSPQASFLSSDELVEAGRAAARSEAATRLLKLTFSRPLSE